MPALPAVSKVVRVALSGTLGASGVWLTRFYLQYTGTAPTNSDLNTFNGACGSSWVTDIAPITDQACYLLSVESEDLTSATSAVATTATSHGGSRTGATLPAQVCAVASYEISRRYRGGHPRGYWRFGTSTDITDSRDWSSTALTAFTSGINAYFTALVGSGWSGAGTISHVNVSFYSGFTVVTNPTTGRARNVPTVRGTPLVDPVTSLIMRPSFGTQRRRESFVD